MSQKLERQVLQRTYTYDNGDYLMMLDLGRTDLDCDLDFDRGHLHVTVYHPDRGMIGEFSVPVRERIEGGPEYKHHNGIITLKAQLDTETDANNFDNDEDAYSEAEEIDKIEDPEPVEDTTDVDSETETEPNMDDGDNDDQDDVEIEDAEEGTEEDQDDVEKQKSVDSDEESEE